MFTLKHNLYFLSAYLILLYFLLKTLCFPKFSFKTVPLEETKAFTATLRRNLLSMVLSLLGSFMFLMLTESWETVSYSHVTKAVCNIQLDAKKRGWLPTGSNLHLPELHHLVT